jgi:hypothetical protein
LTGVLGGAYGAINSSTTIDGFSYQALVDVPYNVKQGGGYHDTQLFLSGFTSDPGKAFITSLAANGKTFVGSQAGSYVYHNGQASWSWPTGPVFDGKTGPVMITMLHPGLSGWIRPKYQIVGLTYAPPGAKSTATYSNGFLSGTGTTNTGTFMSGLTTKVSVSAGGSIGVLNGNLTDSVATSWVQEQDSSSSLTIAQQEATGLTVLGPASSALGVDHDFDSIYIWLNPDTFIEFSPTGTVYQGQYGWDARDTITGMDVVNLSLGQLKGTQAITDPATLTRLNRMWDPLLGGLTSTYYLAIAASDPFYGNPALNPNTDTSGRFEFPESGSPAQPTDLIFNYIPAPPGGQPTSQTYTSNYTSTSVAGKIAKDTHITTYTIDATAGASFAAKVSADWSQVSTYTTTNQWSNTVTGGTTQVMNVTIVSPLATDNYVGPTAMQVWKDNVYGTFMFYPEN